MSDKGSIATGRSDYLSARSRSAQVFRLGARLPEQVFKDDAKESLFCEFDALLSTELWPALSTMARWHGDRHVQLLVVEPDYDFYLSEGLDHPAFSLPVEADEDDYWAAIGFEPDGDALGSIAISANVVAFTGASGKWGCWGERNPELAVFQGFRDATTRDDWSGMNIAKASHSALTSAAPSARRATIRQ